MKVLTFDLEVENHRKYKRLADPFNAENYVVEAGWSWNGGKVESQRFNKKNCQIYYLHFTEHFHHFTNK